MWQVTQMVRWGQLDHAIDMKKAVEGVYRPDLFAAAAKEVNYAVPANGWKVEGKAGNKFMDGSIFDPNKAVDYIYSAPIKHPKITKEALAKVNTWKVKN
jgi:nitrate/nitrite transport system substrate-binding protein